MTLALNIIEDFILTEKATNLSANLNQYTFKVATSATKAQIAKAVEDTFSVTVTKVNVLKKKPQRKRDRTRRGSFGTKSGIKKAIITLKEGDKIELI